VTVKILFFVFLFVTLAAIVASKSFSDFLHGQLLQSWAENNNQNLEEYEAIVVLGRGARFRESRVQVVADLWRSPRNLNRNPIIFASGINDALEIQAMLKAIAIPEGIIQGEDQSRTTSENAENTLLALKPQGISKILLVTDPFHLRRSLLTFQQQGFTVGSVSSPLPDNFSKRDRRLLILREYLAFIAYKVSGRLRAD
jgi:uncharacterized SAM-binding protein YcdF (DUF218 family)